MARPQSYDPEAVLDQAMQLFWRQGYAATSVADLVAATGVNRFSLYARWGDKRGLYLAALARYGEQVGGKWLAAFLEGAEHPLLGIHAAFRAIRDAIAIEGDQRGCFVLNTALELGADDPEALSVVRGNLDHAEAGFRTALTRAAVAGLLPAASVDAHARHLAVSFQALMLQARNGAPVETLDAFVSITLSTLPEVHP